ncbi:MAG: heavy-metal-associated domain-containing protein [Pirellulales bacterium]|nr:heavy-metal-associated domain-containing protein [Pirellulales bacterium]
MQPAVFNAAGGPTATFTVEGMACAHACAPKVQKILASQPGVSEACVDFDTKTATCVIDKETFDPATAISALADGGFTATEK